MKKDFFIKLTYYVIIGIYGVVIDISVSNFFYNLPILPQNFVDFIHKSFPLTLVATIAALLGGTAGLVNNFMMNEYLVYYKTGDKYAIKRFIRYFVAILIGSFFIGKFLILNFCLTFFHLGFSTSNLIAIAIGTLINYPINYFWTWGENSFTQKIKDKILVNKKENIVKE